MWDQPAPPVSREGESSAPHPCRSAGSTPHQSLPLPSPTGCQRVATCDAPPLHRPQPPAVRQRSRPTDAPTGTPRRPYHSRRFAPSVHQHASAPSCAGCMPPQPPHDPAASPHAQHVQPPPPPAQGPWQRRGACAQRSAPAATPRQTPPPAPEQEAPQLATVSPTAGAQRSCPTAPG